MDTKKTEEADFTNDEYWGKGGRYVVNPATGKREPAPAVDEAAAAVAGTVPSKIGQRPDDSASGVQVDGQALGTAAAGDNTTAEADLKKTLKERNRG